MADGAPVLPPDAETHRSRRVKLRKRLGERVAENLWLKVTSVGIAILLWYVITRREPTARSVPVRLRLALDSTLALKNEPKEIYAVVQGTPAELARLEGRTATVSRSINAQTPDTLVISLSPNDVSLPGNVGDARVTDIRPRQVRLEFVPTLTRRVPVRSMLKITPMGSVTAPTLEIEPARVEISGPRLAVLAVAFVRTDTTTILATDSIPHQVAIDTIGLGVTVKPDQVRIRVVPRPPR
jgi:hypothetical protein